MANKPGRPARAWRWLVHDVDIVRRDLGCSVLDACGYLADGYMPEKLQVVIPESAKAAAATAGLKEGRHAVVMGNWRGMNVLTLERMYYRRETHQKKST
jgi:hypothetical protein